MASPRANYIIEITGSRIPAAKGTKIYEAFIRLQECHGKSYQTFRDLAGGPKGTSERNFSPSLIIERAEAGNFARLIPPSTSASQEHLNFPEIARESGSSLWSDEELKAALSVYTEILNLELAGEIVNKAEANRNLRAGILKNRSAASIEYRMQNVSAFLLSESMPIVRGYRPAKNIGTNVIFRLKALWQELPGIEAYTLVHDEEKLIFRAKRLTGAAPIPIPVGVRHPKTVQGATKVFYRSPAVVAYVQQKADGICEACSSPGPFCSDDGTHFLEVHHVTPLSAGGPDTVDNAVAVCPNCHRAFHFSSDRHKRTTSIIERVMRLNDYRSS